MAEQKARVLVIEDEGLVANALEGALTAFGFEVVGPAPTIKTALGLIAKGEVDAALLDVNLNGERVDPVAEALDASSIPFAFSTGYSTDAALPQAFLDHPTLRKPFQADELLLTVNQLLHSRDDRQPQRP